MIPVRWTENDRHEWSGTSIQGMQFACYLTHTTANTAFTANPLDLSLIKMKLRFWKDKSRKWFTIFDDAAIPLVLHSAFYDGNFQQCLQIGTFVGNVFVAAAMSVDEVLLVNFKVKLPEPINATEPGDKLVFEVQVPAGAVSSLVDTAVSTFYYDVIETIGVGRSVPVIKAESLRASISSDKYSVNDGALDVSFINIDKAGITSANQVIVDSQFAADKWQGSDDYFDLLSHRNGMFEDLAQANVRNQSFKLFDMLRYNKSGMPVRLNKGQLSMTYNSANVVAGKNWYVTTYLENDDNVLAYYKSRVPGQLEANINAARQ